MARPPRPYRKLPKGQASRVQFWVPNDVMARIQDTCDTYYDFVTRDELVTDLLDFGLGPYIERVLKPRREGGK